MNSVNLTLLIGLQSSDSSVSLAISARPENSFCDQRSCRKQWHFMARMVTGIHYRTEVFLLFAFTGTDWINDLVVERVDSNSL